MANAPFALPLTVDGTCIVDDLGHQVAWCQGQSHLGNHREHAQAIVTAVNAHEKLLAIAKKVAAQCRECYGQGRRMTHPAGVAEDCFACADIRSLLTSCKREGET